MKAKLFVAVILAATLSMTPDAFGGWGWHSRSAGSYGGSWGSWGGGGWGSYGGGYYSRGWGNYGSWGGGGSYGSWGGGWRARHWGGSYGGWGRSYSSYYGGSYGGNWGSYGGGSWGGYRTYSYAAPVVTYSAPVVYDACSPVVYQSAPVVTDDCCGGVVEESYPVESYDSGTETYEAAPMETAPMETMPLEATPEPDGEARRGDAALIVVNVPADAEVYVNGYRTSSRGSTRQFLSTGLEDGKSYVYEVRAVAKSDDEEVGETKVVRLTAGRREELSFVNLHEPAETTLTLQVPKGAEVELAGVMTKMTGSKRVFATDTLTSGESWNDYQIRVTFEQNGATVTREHTMTIRGGESHFLAFETDSQLAAR